MFPVDPKIARTNVTSSVATSRRAQFRSDTADRDGNRCVLTGMDELVCDAVHLLAHSKGDTVCYSYSHSILAHHRNGASTFLLILNVAIETLLVATSYRTSTASEMAFF